MIPKDFLMLLIFARGKTLKDNEKIPTKTHLQKEMFLLTKESIYSNIDIYDFVPLYYGPFSKNLAIDLDSLIEKNLVDDSEGIILSLLGFKRANEFWIELGDKDKSQFIKIKEKYNRMNREDLTDYVYKKYPKFAIKSALKKEVVDAYFDKFWDEHNLTEEKLIDAALSIRYS